MLQVWARNSGVVMVLDQGQDESAFRRESQPVDTSGALCRCRTEGRDQGLTYKGSLDFVRVDD